MRGAIKNIGCKHMDFSHLHPDIPRRMQINPTQSKNCRDLAFSVEMSKKEGK